MSSKTGSSDQAQASDMSFGPFNATGDGTVRFDTSLREVPIWLGYYPSAMCGVVQYAETWTGQWSPEILRLHEASVRLRARTKDQLCGRLKLKPYLGDANSETTMNPAEVIYDYIALSVLDQFSETHRRLANSIEDHCEWILNQHGNLFLDSYVDSANFEFGFEFANGDTYEAFIAALPKAGIENTQVENNEALQNRLSKKATAANHCVFVLNLAYREWLDTFWHQLDDVLLHFRDSDHHFKRLEISSKTDHTGLIEFQRALQLAKSSRVVPDEFKPQAFLRREFANRELELETVVVDENNYADFRQRILDMQIEVYEPVRRSPPQEFDMLFDSEKPLSILVFKDDRIVAMVFAGRLGLFLQERGVSSDPFLKDPTVYYSMDLTVAEKYRGCGMGILLKQAMAMLAIENGVTALHGRNRDRLAAGMWAINLSLGAYELQHLPDDYPDDEPYRDCIYYRCPLTWSSHMSKDDLALLPIRSTLQGFGLNSRG